MVGLSRKQPVVVIPSSQSQNARQSRPSPWTQVESKYPVGAKVKGKVVHLIPRGAILELEPGIYGFLRVSELSRTRRIKHPAEVLKIGDAIAPVVLRRSLEKKKISLSLRELEADPWDQAEGKYPVGSKVKGKVFKLVGPGAFVELEPGVEGLIPLAEFSWGIRITNPSDVLKQEQELEVVVLSMNRTEKKILLSLRQLKANPWTQASEKYPPGTKVKGSILKLVNYGAFLKLEDGLDGLIHVTEISWTHKINRPAEVLKLGDEVQAVVLAVDLARQRIALSMKQLEADPWDKINDLYKVGDLVTGKITKLAFFGAFVGLQHGINGLLHITQISEEPVEKIKDVLKVEQEVTVRITKIDRASRRIGLSLKAVNYTPVQFNAELTRLASLPKSAELEGMEQT